MKTLLMLGLLGLAGCAETSRIRCNNAVVSDVVYDRLTEISSHSNPTEAEWGTLLEWSRDIYDSQIRGCYGYWIGVHLDILRRKRDQAAIQQSIPYPPAINKEKQ